MRISRGRAIRRRRMTRRGPLICIGADNPKGEHRRALASRAWLRAVLQCAARYDVERRARQELQAGRSAMSAFRLPAAGGSTAARTCAFRFDGRRLCGASRRYAGLGAAGERRASGRALVQVSPAARHPGGGAEEPNALVTIGGGPGGARRTCGRLRSRFTRGWWRRARTGFRRWSSTWGRLPAWRRRVAGRVLLQDVHWSRRGVEADL